jgi:hypothetical protein
VRCGRLPANDTMASFRQRMIRTLRARNTRALRLSHYLKRRLARRAHCLFVTSFPKSGSTFLCAALSEATGFLQYALSHGFMGEQELYLPRLLDSYSLDIVANQHSLASKVNLELIEEFGIRPVILTRKLYDICVSLRDKLPSDPWLTPSYPVNERFLALSKEEQFDHIITLALPRYIAFFAGWKDACAAGTVEALWLDYDELIADKAGAIERVLGFHGLTHPPARIEEAVRAVEARGETRFNKGVPGRGASELSEAQRARIAALADPYPWIDFSPIGLPCRCGGEPLVASVVATKV